MRSLATNAAFLLLAFSAAAPSAAQIVSRPNYGKVTPPNPFIGESRLPGPGVGREVGQVRREVDHARDNGALSRREARRLDREARQIDRLARRYGRDGLSEGEWRELEGRIHHLRASVDRARSAGAGAGADGRR